MYDNIHVFFVVLRNPGKAIQKCATDKTIAAACQKMSERGDCVLVIALMLITDNGTIDSNKVATAIPTECVMESC